jgi:hypothetical protein
MKLSELEPGSIFTIGETPSYPKLRTEYGYLDMRDQIKKVCDDLPWSIRPMSKEEVARQFDFTLPDVEEWLEALSTL